VRGQDEPRLVADRENHRVQIFREDGKFITQWTDLFRPTAVCIDKNDIVYVSELCMRISVFTIDGELLARWGNDGDSARIGCWSLHTC